MESSSPSNFGLNMSWTYSDYYDDVIHVEEEVDNVTVFEHKETAALYGYYRLRRVVVYRDDVITARSRLEHNFPTLFGSLRDLVNSQ